MGFKALIFENRSLSEEEDELRVGGEMDAGSGGDAGTRASSMVGMVGVRHLLQTVEEPLGTREVVSCDAKLTNFR